MNNIEKVKEIEKALFSGYKKSKIPICDKKLSSDDIQYYIDKIDKASKKDESNQKGEE